MADHGTAMGDTQLVTSGLAAAICEGTAATDNLSSVMRDSVVIFQSTLTLQGSLLLVDMGKPLHDVDE